MACKMMGRIFHFFQQPVIDTIHKDDKPQKLTTKERGSQNAVSKHIYGKFSGRKMS